ncbi:MAG: hypothetical protein Tsb0015_04710 [Simkaniaceae bacterium]
MKQAKTHLFFIFFLLSAVWAENPSAPSIDDFMNKQEQKTTGVETLSNQQKEALAKWLEAKLKTSSPQPKEKAALTLSENRFNGKILILSDGSQWQISPDDIDRSSLWLTPFPVRIERNDENLNYPYRILNNYTGSSVKARKIQGGGS